MNFDNLRRASVSFGSARRAAVVNRRAGSSWHLPCNTNGTSHQLAGLVLIGCLAGSPAPTVAADPDPAATVPAAAAAPVFSPFRPLKGDGERVFGNPSVAGQPFVVRIKEFPGSIIPPHHHNFDENITVVQGTWYFGIGPKFNRKALHKLPVGSFVFIPRGTPMFGYAPNGATVQVHGIGPFDQHWIDGLNTLTDKIDVGGSLGAEPAKFRFKPGDRVRTPRGAGRIVDGVVTGDLVQYMLMGANHQVFVAQESEVRKQ